MSDLNKVISLFIGLFVIVFIVAFLLGRFKIGGKKFVPRLGGALGPVFNIKTPTPSPAKKTPNVSSKTETKTITIKKTVSSNNQTLAAKPAGMVKGETVTATTKNSMTDTEWANNQYSQIPKTGPEMMFPLALTSLLVGLYLKRLGLSS